MAKLGAFVLALAVIAPAGTAASPAEGGAAGPGTPRLATVRSLIRTGDLRQAMLLARDSAHPAEAAVALGEIAYRLADFDAAEQHFAQALGADSAAAAAHLGLGRVDLAHFRRRSAAQHFVNAYGLAPNDPEVIRAYARVASDPQQEMALWSRYLALGAGEPRQFLEAALARLRLRERLAGRRLNELATPYRSYRIPVSSWVPVPGSSAGLVVRVSINGSKPLRMVFDTGAWGIYLNARIAERLQLERVSDAAVGGLGSGGWRQGYSAVADSVRIGELEYRNSLVDVTAEPIAAGADGVLGIGILERFLLRLDAADGALELLPYADAAPPSRERVWSRHDRITPPGMEDFAELVQVNRALLLRARLDGRRAGYFLVDTGAARTTLSTRLLRTAELADWDPVSMNGAGGELLGARLGLVRLEFAGRLVQDTRAIAVDFREMSNRHGVEISGLIGYPALSRGVITINLRDGLLGMKQ